MCVLWRAVEISFGCMEFQRLGHLDREFYIDKRFRVLEKVPELKI